MEQNTHLKRQATGIAGSIQVREPGEPAQLCVCGSTTVLRQTQSVNILDYQGFEHHVLDSLNSNNKQTHAGFTMGRTPLSMIHIY